MRLCIEVGSALDQSRGDLGLIRVSSSMQGRPSVVVRVIHVRICRKQSFDQRKTYV